MNKKILYHATSNAGKFALFSKFVPENSGVELRQFSCELFEEQIEDQEQIALSKAKQAWAQLQKPLIVDEFGVYFDQYHNFPGAFTKFVFKGIGFDGLYKLMNDGDAMSMHLYVVYIYGPEQYKIFTVNQPGTFRRGAGTEHDKRTPFLSVFVPNGYDKTYAELDSFPEIYNKISVRALAIQEVIAFMKSQNNNI